MKPRLAVDHRLDQRTGASGDHRRPRRHRLDRDQPERLGPATQHHGRQGTRVQRVALLGAELAQELDRPVVDGGLDDLPEVPLLRVEVDLGRDLERDAARAAEGDRVLDALLGRDAAHERQVVARPVLERHARERQAVVDRRDPALVREEPPLAVADRDQRHVRMRREQLRHALRVEAPVQRADHRRVAALGEHEVVLLHVRVDDVEVPGRPPGDLDGVLQVGVEPTRVTRRPQALVDRLDVLVRDLRIARGDERHVMPAAVQLVAEGGDHAFGARVGGRRDGQHGRGDEEDAERVGLDRHRSPGSNRPRVGAHGSHSITPVRCCALAGPGSGVTAPWTPPVPGTAIRRARGPPVRRSARSRRPG